VKAGQLQKRLPLCGMIEKRIVNVSKDLLNGLIKKRNFKCCIKKIVKD